jgi:hypothetical protein
MIGASAVRISGGKLARVCYGAYGTTSQRGTMIDPSCLRVGVGRREELASVLLILPV